MKTLRLITVICALLAVNVLLADALVENLRSNGPVVEASALSKSSFDELMPAINEPTDIETSRGDIEAILAVPLFEPTRLPPQPEPAPTKPVAEPKIQTQSRELNATLLGTIVQSSGSIALLRLEDSSIVRIPQGTDLFGWTLVEVTLEGARFTNESKEKFLGLVVE